MERLVKELHRLCLPSVGQSMESKAFVGQLLDNTDVMQLLHISPRMLQTLRSNGTLAFTKLGGKIYYRREDIDQVLRNRYVMFKLKAHGKEERV